MDVKKSVVKDTGGETIATIATIAIDCSCGVQITTWPDYFTACDCGREYHAGQEI